MPEVCRIAQVLSVGLHPAAPAAAPQTGDRSEIPCRRMLAARLCLGAGTSLGPVRRACEVDRDTAVAAWQSSVLSTHGVIQAPKRWEHSHGRKVTPTTLG